MPTLNEFQTQNAREIFTAAEHLGYPLLDDDILAVGMLVMRRRDRRSIDFVIKQLNEAVRYLREAEGNRFYKYLTIYIRPDSGTPRTYGIMEVED